MLQALYESKIIGITSKNKSNKFIFWASGINKEFIFKSYQSKIKFSNLPSTILMILMMKAKPLCQVVKQVDDKKIFIIFIVRKGLLLTTIRVFFNIILLIAISSVQLMFPGSLWIKNVSDPCASAPISTSVPATHQGIFYSLHTLCTPEKSVNIHVLHSPGTSSVTVQTETSLKSHLSISETLIDRGRQYIKFDSLFISTYIEALKIIKHFKSLSFQIVVADQVYCVLKIKTYFSISETVLEHSRLFIRLDGIFISTYSKACRIFNRLKPSPFQKVNREQILCLSLNLPPILNLNFVCKHPPSTYLSYKKCKPGIFKRNLTISYEVILIKSNVLVIYIQKTYKNPLDLINLTIFKHAKAYKRSVIFPIISNTVLIINNNGDI